MEPEQDRDLWAVITTSAGKYLLGNIEYPAKKGEVLDVLQGSGVLKLSRAYELNVQMIPIPVGPGQMQIQREVNATPYILTLVDTILYVQPSALQFFEDMKDADQTRYKRLVEQASRLAETARQQDAGIIPARPDQIPPHQGG